MFRKGGSAGEGITSGLRQGYETAGDVKQNDLSKIDLRNMDMQQIKDLADKMAFQAPPMAPDNSLRDFKIDFGLDLVSRTPGGNIFQTAGAAAKEPFSRFQASKAAYNKGVQDRAITKYNSQTGMLKRYLMHRPRSLDQKVDLKCLLNKLTMLRYNLLWVICFNYK